MKQNRYLGSLSNVSAAAARCNIIRTYYNVIRIHAINYSYTYVNASDVH